ncbi:MAG: NAD(+)/NADH kinase [Lentisphaeria bacterium]|nr:NAD(+)/NADH kinase [Lentisphaeria bacterium]
MEIKLFGKNLHNVSAMLEKYGFCDSGNGTPELIVTYGGDGALLGAVRDYPEIPKFPLRDTETAPTCARHQTEKIIAGFAAGKLAGCELPCIIAAAPGGELSGINDLVLHSCDPACALRFRVFIDGELHAKEVFGDGICFATPHGSTGYFRSITRGTFRTGVGVAFNNSSEAVNHLVLPEDSAVTVEILRGPALLIADNDPHRIKVEVGEKVKFFKSGKTALIHGLKEFMCPECRKRRHHLHSLNEDE